MSFNANEQPTGGGFDFEPMDAGTYPARLVGVSLVGLHSQTFQGEVKEPKNNIALTYEFLDEFLKDEDGNELTDKPRFLTERMPFYNLSSERAKSTDRYLSIDPQCVHGGDWSRLLEIPLMVTVVQTPGKGKNLGKVFNNVAGVSPMRPKEAAKAPDLVNSSFLFNFDDPSKEDWDRLPNAVKSIVKKALNYSGSEMEGWASEDEDRKDQEVNIEDNPPKKTRTKVVFTEKEEETKNDQDW